MNIRPASATDVPEGELLGVLVDGKELVVGRVGGRLYAIDGTCTHQYADLENARIEGTTVVCHFHGSAFDIRTGAVVRPPATEPVNSHAVGVEDGRILIHGVQADVRVGYHGLHDTG